MKSILATFNHCFRYNLAKIRITMCTLSVKLLRIDFLKAIIHIMTQKWWCMFELRKNKVNCIFMVQKNNTTGIYSYSVHLWKRWLIICWFLHKRYQRGQKRDTLENTWLINPIKSLSKLVFSTVKRYYLNLYGFKNLYKSVQIKSQWGSSTCKE